MPAIGHETHNARTSGPIFYIGSLNFARKLSGKKRKTSFNTFHLINQSIHQLYKVLPGMDGEVQVLGIISTTFMSKELQRILNVRNVKLTFQYCLTMMMQTWQLWASTQNQRQVLATACGPWTNSICVFTQSAESTCSKFNKIPRGFLMPLKYNFFFLIKWQAQEETVLWYQRLNQLAWSFSQHSKGTSLGTYQFPTPYSCTRNDKETRHLTTFETWVDGDNTMFNFGYKYKSWSLSSGKVFYVNSLIVVCLCLWNILHPNVRDILPPPPHSLKGTQRIWACEGDVIKERSTSMI